MRFYFMNWMLARTLARLKFPPYACLITADTIEDLDRVTMFFSIWLLWGLVRWYLS